MKKDSSALIGITIGTILFLLMIPSLVQIGQDDTFYDFQFGHECEQHEHEDNGHGDTYVEDRSNSSVNREKHDKYVLKRLVGDPSHKYSQEHYIYKDIYKGFLPNFT